VNAHRSGLLPHVQTLYELHYPAAVATELRPSFPSGAAFWRSVAAGELQPVSYRVETIQEFGPGERAAMNVVAERPDWILLIDDRRPLEHALRMGFKAICSPILVVQGYSQLEITAVDALTLLARLSSLQTVSPRLLTPALHQLALLIQSRQESPHGNA
jgi:hypothetical protein